MQKIYLNTRKREFYDATGCRFASGYPKIAYKRSERFAIQLCVESPGAETEGCKPEEWVHDTQFDISGITALLSVDNDFRRRRKGTLEAAVSAGNVSTIAANFDGASAAVIRKEGVLQLFSDDEEAEGVQYTGFSVSGNKVTFTLAENSSLAKSYDSGSQADVPEALYMQAAMSVTDSKPEDGLFVFDLVAYSPKLRAVMEYADMRKLNAVAGMEILLFTMGADGTRTECDSYLCETCSVTATMAEANPNPQLPDTARDTLSGLVAAVMSNGMEAEFSADGAEWHPEQNVEADTFVHFRLKGTSYGWSTPMSIPRGMKGADGADAPEAPKDGHFYCRKDGAWVAVNVTAIGDVTVSGTRSYTRTGSVGSMFSLTFDAVASDGSAVAITLKSGTVPNGLSLSGKTLSGTPTAEGSATLVFAASSGAASMDITVSLTIQKAAVMYYGYVAATNSMYKVTSLTAAALSSSTVKSAAAETKDKTSLGDAPAGSLIFVLIPKSANLKAVKFDGISGWCEFEENRGANGTGTNGAEVTIAGTVYRVYGEATLVDSETFIKVETI